MKTRRDFNSGFSLIEVMVSVAIFMIGLVAVSDLLLTTRDSTRIGDAMLELSSVGSIIRETVRFDATCNAALIAQNSSGFSRSDVLSGNRTLNIVLPGVLGDSTPADDVLRGNTQLRKTTITSIRLVNAIEVAPDRYFSNIEVSATDRKNNIAMKPVVVGGFFFTTTGAAITNCGSLGVDQANLCAEMSCTYNVNATPACQCPTVQLSCPPQQFLTGVDGSGQLICTPFGNGACPAGTYLRGVGIGISDCVPLM